MISYSLNHVLVHSLAKNVAKHASFATEPSYSVLFEQFSDLLSPPKFLFLLIVAHKLKNEFSLSLHLSLSIYIKHVYGCFSYFYSLYCTFKLDSVMIFLKYLLRYKNVYDV